MKKAMAVPATTSKMMTTTAATIIEVLPSPLLLAPAPIYIARLHNQSWFATLPSPPVRTETSLLASPSRDLLSLRLTFTAATFIM